MEQVIWDEIVKDLWYHLSHSKAEDYAKANNLEVSFEKDLVNNTFITYMLIDGEYILREDAIYEVTHGQPNKKYYENLNGIKKIQNYKG